MDTSSPLDYGSAVLGSSIPLQTPHALSVSLPTWEDNIGWAAGDPSVVNVMTTGYPRFFVHRSIQKLAHICIEKLGIENELAMLFPTTRIAAEGLSYMLRHASTVDAAPLSPFRVLHLTLEDNPAEPEDVARHALAFPLELHLLLFPTSHWKLAKSFWQHAGMGISSRYAEDFLVAMSTKTLHEGKAACGPSDLITPTGRSEKLLIRRRIADLVNGVSTPLSRSPGEPQDVYLRSKKDYVTTQDDVFLYSTGMAAIWHSHQLALSLRPDKKSVCFGFSYTDTIKVLKNWGPGCHFFFEDPDTNLLALEALLKTLSARTETSSSYLISPISALFVEFPSNPLLQSPNLPRLRQLADQYDFLIVVDETIGNFVNVNVLEYADIAVTSLSKAYSGSANVMGGSLVLNVKSRHYDRIKSSLRANFVDDFYYADAIVMELNSQDFATRVHLINENTEAVCDFLRSRSLEYAETANTKSSRECEQFVIKDVFFPKWVTRKNYDLCRRPGSRNNFGPLFSLTFTSSHASRAFYDTLPCAKGPSLGTNFTLACPYTILAHYNELEWVAQYGIEEGSVRVSVGMEDRETLMRWFKDALEAAEKSVPAKYE